MQKIKYVLTQSFRGSLESCGEYSSWLFVFYGAAAITVTTWGATLAGAYVSVRIANFSDKLCLYAVPFLFGSALFLCSGWFNRPELRREEDRYADELLDLLDSSRFEGQEEFPFEGEVLTRAEVEEALIQLTPLGREMVRQYKEHR